MKSCLSEAPKIVRKWTVYLHLVPNGKMYVGITSTTLEKRFLNGKGYRTSMVFAKAIKKYGWENIKHFVLYQDLTQQQAERKEIEIIAKHHLNDKRYGYNVAIGGCVNRGYKLTKEHKEKLRNAKIGKYFGGNNPSAKSVVCVNTGEIFSTTKEASDIMKCCRENISACCRGRLKSAGKHPLTGERLKWRYAERGEKNENRN